MKFEYSVKPFTSIEDQYEFPCLGAGASLWCAKREQAAAVASAYNRWSFKVRGPLYAAVEPVALNDPKPSGYRVWIKQNDIGIEALGIDPVTTWFEERVEPYPFPGRVSDCPRTGELYQDFKSWASRAGFNDKWLPPASTFSQRLKASQYVDLRRRSEGMFVIGARLKPTAEGDHGEI